MDLSSAASTKFLANFEQITLTLPPNFLRVYQKKIEMINFGRSKILSCQVIENSFMYIYLDFSWKCFISVNRPIRIQKSAVQIPIDQAESWTTIQCEDQEDNENSISNQLSVWDKIGKKILILINKMRPNGS